MSGEFEDVLTNQPVVIDNVRGISTPLRRTRVLLFGCPRIGLGDDQSRICWTGSSKMFLPVFVRLLHG